MQRVASFWQIGTVRPLAPTMVVALALTAVSMVVPSSGASASHGQRVYVSENLGGRVSSISMDGHVTPLANIDSPRALALRGQTLFINVADGIATLPASGGTPSLGYTLAEPFGLAVSGDDLFVTDDAGRLTVLSVSKGTAKVLLSGLTLPRGIAIAGNTVFVSETGAGRVVGIPRSGGTPWTLVDGLAGPTGLAIVDETLYIAEVFTGRVLAIPVSGGSLTTVASGLSGPRSLAATRDTLFIADYGTGRILALPTSGGDLVAIAEGLNGPVGVAVP